MTCTSSGTRCPIRRSILMTATASLSVTQKMPRRMGQRVPEDVQVIGYDGLRAFGDQDYYCSTIIQPVEAMAETCVDLVLQDSHANTPSLLCLPVRYAYGGTTKA